MRVKLLFLAIITGSALQSAAARDTQPAVTQKATITLDSVRKTARAQPFIIDGQVIDSIGFSADTRAHDDEIAQAALTPRNRRTAP
ncbi:hypothetical protein K5F93_12710 [Pseudomonas protegens]|uniref:hypothetical protein n=1 Tax=Pseudomonas protegens TaxID=380021 RepID=UPI001C8D3588|nr:hypothetical protein [Pseudomonas protegens]QZI73038.1 hypothetical protein K5F93_12710 [Pseudomonas protegens]